MRIRLAAAALALAAVSSVASAQAAPANPWSFGVSVGARLPMGDFGNVANTGFGGAGHVWYGFGEGWSLRGDVSYDTWGAKTGGSSASALGFGVNGVYDIQMDGGFKPYVLAGVGMYSSSYSGCGGPCPAGESKIGFGGGAGANFAAGGQTWFVEARYVTVQTSGTSTSFIPLTVGIKF